MTLKPKAGDHTAAGHGDLAIRALEAIPISIPLVRPVKWARGHITAIEHVHNGSNADMHIGSAASAHFACTYDTQHAHEMSYFIDAADTVTDEVLKIRDGCLVLPDRPGIGLNLDPAKLRKYRVDS